MASTASAHRRCLIEVARRSISPLQQNFISRFRRQIAADASGREVDVFAPRRQKAMNRFISYL
jgi:hypothetical protein